MVAVGEEATPRNPRHIGVREILAGALRRPAGILQGTRWLFTWLALLSLLFGLPGILLLRTSNAASILLLAAATITLAGSWTYGYLRQRVPLALELLDAVALTAFAVSDPWPGALVPVLFASAWLRSLYGSLGRAVLRGALYTAAVLAVSVLMPAAPGTPTETHLLQQGGVVSIVLLVIAVSGQLRKSLRSHDWAIERDRALTETGAKMLGLTDPERIRGLAWATAHELVATTPGLRVLKAARDGDRLRIGANLGHFVVVPQVLPGSVLPRAGRLEDARINDAAPLNRAVGSDLVWECVPLTEEVNDAWLIVGAPRRIPESILLSVHGLVNQVNLALRNSQAHQQLTEQAENDALTGLDNRSSFTAKLATELARQGDDGLHVLFVDLDDFKDVNDQLGHRAGDSVLTEVAERMRHCTRPHDVVARLGGDEFAVVLHGTTDAAAATIAHRMVDALAQPIVMDGRPVRVSASVGVASAVPGIVLDELVHRADVAMYAAKANGKGRVKVFSTGLLDSGSSLVSFERQLGRAAGRGELVLHYQPIVALADRQCVGAEALVRWEHPERGLLMPEDFMALAGASGAIVGVGAFVLRQACADAATWPAAQTGAPLTVHVNISARELENEHFVESVLWCLADSALPAGRLMLEVTETVLLDSPPAVHRLSTLAEHGVQIAIADFGTGFASLSALRMLPITVLKLDANFVAGALGNRMDRGVLEAVVEMSAKLGIRTIAQGVERADQQQLLAQVGADAAQGQLYCPALPVEPLRAWLQRAAQARTG